MPALRLPAVMILGGLTAILGGGCLAPYQRIDSRLVLRARTGIAKSTSFGSSQERGYRQFEDEFGEVPETEPVQKSVLVGELLAIFPGLLVHGLGHYYAGDYTTARKIREIGEWGYLLTAIGGGMVLGAFFLDESSDEILPLSLYVAGGTVGGIGVAYFFTAWVSDIWDTPRAIRSGGEPWSFFEDDEDFLE